MKYVSVLIVLAALALAGAPVQAQHSGSGVTDRQAKKAMKHQQKISKKLARKQAKAMKKYAKAQKKQNKKARQQHR